MTQEVEKIGTQCDLLIVGATLEALHLLTRLNEGLLGKTVVVDASGTWLSSFESRMECLGPEMMRMPVTMHPHPKQLALKYFAQKNKRTKELCEVLDGYAALPSGKLFLDFCKNCLDTLHATSIKNVLKDRVAALEFAGHVDDCELVTAVLQSGSTISCKAVVVAVNEMRPIIPKWVAKAFDQGIPRDNFKTYEDLDFSRCQGSLGGKCIVVVGGGMMASLLVDKAVSNGAEEVVMLSRRNLRNQAFDCDPGWWGIKYVNSYLNISDPTVRLKMCRQAKAGGSMNPVAWEKLFSITKVESLSVLEGCDVHSVEQSSEGRLKLCVDKNSDLGKLDSCSLDTGHASAFSKATGMEAINNETGHYVTQKGGNLADGKQTEIHCDEIWLACGNAFDAGSHSLLASICKQLSNPIVGGYPVLLDNFCCLHNAPVFVMGRGAMLSIGPASGSFAGLKMSADRIGSALNAFIDGQSHGSYAPWKAEKGEKNSECNTFDPVMRAKEWTSYSLGELSLEDESKIRACSLESQNIMFIDKKSKSKVTEDRNKIDVSDISGSLPRQEVQNFSYIDDDFEISVVMNLPEPITREKVRAKVTQSSLEAWIVGEKGAYHLNVPKLYGKVLPERSRVVTKEAKNRVIIILHKEKDVEWKFLKG
eukprot:jgi/Picsp_1/4814/NSC_02182-R1_cog2072: flavoprotein involved in k+ transport